MNGGLRRLTFLIRVYQLATALIDFCVVLEQIDVQDPMASVVPHLIVVSLVIALSLMVGI